jgi:hypothetical protein
MIRLDNNEFTKQICNTLAEIKFENSYTTQIATHMNLKDYEYDTLLNSAESAVKLLDSDKKYMRSKPVNDNVLAIRAVFKTRNRFEYSNKMFNLLKFEVVSYVSKSFKRKSMVLTLKLKTNNNIELIILLIFMIFIIIMLIELIKSHSNLINDRSTLDII